MKNLNMDTRFFLPIHLIIQYAILEQTTKPANDEK